MGAKPTTGGVAASLPTIATFGFTNSQTRKRDGKPTREEIDTCKRWLQLWTDPRKTWPADASDVGSYALKHAVERWAGVYIPNGALLAAAAELDLPVRRSHAGSPNGELRVSVQRWLRHQRQEHGARWPVAMGESRCACGV